MQIRLHPHKSFLSLVTLLLILACARPVWSAECPDIAERDSPHLNILTINLLFSEIEKRDERFEAIADFAADVFPDGSSGDPDGTRDEPADILLLQEVVGGFLVETSNSARILLAKLEEKGLNYDLKTVFEAGVPGVLATANAIASRCEIVFKLATFLPVSETVNALGLDVPITRNVMMTRIEIPGLGKANLYNTHLCANCSALQRGQQVDAMLAFVNSVEQFIGRFTAAESPVVLGGDLNMDIFREVPLEGQQYNQIIGAGFVDGYDEGQSDGLADLCNPGGDPFPDKHCTVEVSPPIDFGGTPRRIDYVFLKDFDVVQPVIESRVVFNPAINPSEPAVSDHAGVLVIADLP